MESTNIDWANINGNSSKEMDPSAKEHPLNL